MLRPFDGCERGSPRAPLPFPGGSGTSTSATGRVAPNPVKVGELNLREENSRAVLWFVVCC